MNDSMLDRLLRQRDQARDSGDVLARSVLAHLKGEQVDLREALQRYIDNDGPAMQLPPQADATP